MMNQVLQILAATMVTAGLLVLAIAQLPNIGQATGMGGRDNFRLLRPGTGISPYLSGMLLTDVGLSKTLCSLCCIQAIAQKPVTTSP